MKRPLNPNAGEFHPTTGGLNTVDGLNEESSSRYSTRQGGGEGLFSTRKTESNVNVTTNTTAPFLGSEGNVEAFYYLPVTHFLMECRATFYNHAESTQCKHMEFERVLRHFFFAAHESNELSISSSFASDKQKAFWLSYSATHFHMAHDIVQEVELGIPFPASELPAAPSSLLSPETASTTPITSSDAVSSTGQVMTTNGSNKECFDSLRQIYLSKIRPLVPCSIRKQLVLHAKRSSVSSNEDVMKGMMYAFDIFFLFTRLQFLQFLDPSSNLSYSACVQFLTKLRERLLKSEVGESFLNVALVLMLISAFHITSLKNMVEIPASDTNSLRLKVQQLFCAYFPSMMVAFLAGSPLQSVEELRHCFISSNIEDSLPVLRTCPGAIAAIKELLSYNNKTTMLWSMTLNEVVAFGLRYMKQMKPARGGQQNDITFLLSHPTPMDDHFHVQYPTVLATLLGSNNNVMEEKELQHFPHQEEGEVNSRSQEFLLLAVKAASASGGSVYETVYFTLLTLVNMQCLGSRDISRLFKTLEDAYTTEHKCAAFEEFLSSDVCRSLSLTARELLDVLLAMIKEEGHHKSRQLQALREVKDIVDKRQWVAHSLEEECKGSNNQMGPDAK